jgi:transposase
MRRHLTGNEAAQAVGMLQADQVQRAVAGHFNVSQSVISSLWNRFQHTGNEYGENKWSKLHSYLFWKQFKNMIINCFCPVYF